jgi:hypothetical protein
MCDFNALSDEEKAIYHERLITAANSFGGKNFFLHLLEEIRQTRPHPLTNANMTFEIDLGKITWNKVIFKDKLDLLLKARKNESQQDNFLPQKESKEFKKVLNVVRTLKPIVFHVKPENPEDGSGFFFQPFNIIDEEKTKLDPLFDAVFFCSIDTVKKVLNYAPRVEDV